MDDFILKNDAWLQYLPIIILTLATVITAFLIVIGFQIYTRYKNQNLKSRKRKSPFALAYTDAYSSNATSSVPLKRYDYTPLQPQQPPQAQINEVRPANPIPDRPMNNNNSNSRVIEFYFDYEDEYKI